MCIILPFICLVDILIFWCHPSWSLPLPLKVTSSVGPAIVPFSLEGPCLEYISQNSTSSFPLFLRENKQIQIVPQDHIHHLCSASVHMYGSQTTGAQSQHPLYTTTPDNNCCCHNDLPKGPDWYTFYFKE